MSSPRHAAAVVSARRHRTDAFWSGDWGLTVLVFLLLVNIFALPLARFVSWGRFGSRLVISLIIISGLVATVRNRRLVLLGAAFTLATLFIGWEDAAHPSVRLHLVNDLVAIPLLGLLLVLISRQLFRDGPITMHRVQGAVAVYLLIGIIWAVAYDLIESVQPGSFAISAALHRSDFATLGYYSFTTLTTLGVGDILPVSPIVRSLTVLEALIGQLFPAILIARLVAMELTHSRLGSHRE